MLNDLLTVRSPSTLVYWLHHTTHLSHMLFAGTLFQDQGTTTNTFNGVINVAGAL